MNNENETIKFVLIPWDRNKELQTLEIRNKNNYDGAVGGGDLLPSYLKNVVIGCVQHDEQVEIEVTPLIRMSASHPSQSSLGKYEDDEKMSCNDSAGMFAYSCTRFSHRENARGEEGTNDLITNFTNIRATCLAMACGLLSRRFIGDIYLGRFGYNNALSLKNISLVKDEVECACISPDIRVEILSKLVMPPNSFENLIIPGWLADATKKNYEDSASLSILASVMNRKGSNSRISVSSENDELDESNKDIDSKDELKILKDEKRSKSNNKNKNTVELTDSTKQVESERFEESQRPTLCLHCLGPSSHLCPDCEGVYFCELPRRCRIYGWSHECVCAVWAIYVQRRNELSTFPFTWHHLLMERPFQISEAPYKDFLKRELRVLPEDGSSWWKTEVDGWKGGLSGSAKIVDASIRCSYQKGFLLDTEMIPPERRLSEEEISESCIERNKYNLVQLMSWEDYYALRGIPLSSPVALLCTFPLTIFHAIERYGAVPITVSKILKRPMRMHVIGVEKEINFLDLFKEVGYLLPEELQIEMVFIVRGDMLPPLCGKTSNRKDYDMKIELTSNVTLLIKSGTYGDSLDPKFDCGSGAPDMIIALNAGLFAYESWRSVIKFLNSNRGIVGVFTDYNEHSGLNCASLGGERARESLCVNPFRQPRAMPAYSMNLPQFSNCFLYVFNEQEVDF